MAIAHLLKALSNFVENVENPKYSILSLAQAEEYLEAEEENIDLEEEKEEELVEDVEEFADKNEIEDEIEEELLDDVDDETVEDNSADKDELEQVDQTEKAVDELDEAIEMFEPTSSSSNKPTTQPSGQNSSVMENLEKVFSENPELAPKGYKDEFPSDDEEDLSDLSESELKIATEAYNYFIKNAENETELGLDEVLSDDEVFSDGGDEDVSSTQTDKDIESILEEIQTAEIQDLPKDENDNSEYEDLPDFDAEDLDSEQTPTLIEPDFTGDEDIEALLEELENDDPTDDPTDDEEALDLDTFEDE